jgi:hypothetical protein
LEISARILNRTSALDFNIGSKIATVISSTKSTTSTSDSHNLTECDLILACARAKMR